MLLLIINLHAYYALCYHKPRALAASLSEIPVSIPVYRYWVFPIPKYRYCQRWSVLEALIPGELIPERWNQEGKTNLDLLEKEIVNGSGITWAICKSAPHPIQIIIVFVQAGCPSCHQPTASKHTHTTILLLVWNMSGKTKKVKTNLRQSTEGIIQSVITSVFIQYIHQTYSCNERMHTSTTVHIVNKL